VAVIKCSLYELIQAVLFHTAC